MPIVGQFGSLAGLGSLVLPGGAMESIATVTVGSGGASSIEFTSIPGTYQHLQIRGVARGDQAAYYTNMATRLNSDTGSNYAKHYIFGDGSTAAAAGGASATSVDYIYATGSSASSSHFFAYTIDILDYASTAKYKTLRAFLGFDNNGSGATNPQKGFVMLTSGLWQSTNAVTSVSFSLGSGVNFVQHSTLALYGLRAP